MRITLRPGLLEDFADVAEQAVADLRTLLPDAVDAVHQYQWLNPDHGVDVTTPLDGTARLSTAIDRLGDEVAQLARAARDLDDDLDNLGMATLDGGALDGRVQELAASWRTVTDLRDMVQPMDRDRWNDLVWGPIPPNCGPAATYTGGGAVVGPDGRTYPLVIPEVIGEDGEIYRASSPDVGEDLQVSTLNGTDPGWTIDHIETGTARVQDRLGTLPAIAVGALGFNASTRPVPAASPEALQTMTITPDGWPSLVEPAHDGPDDDGFTPDLPNTPEELEPRRLRPVHHAGAGALDAAVGVLEGASLVQNANRRGLASYQVLFETHADGRRRAQLRIFQVTEDAHGTPVIDPSATTLDGDHDLEQRPLRFRPNDATEPELHARRLPSQSKRAHVRQLDTETEQRLLR